MRKFLACALFAVVMMCYDAQRFKFHRVFFSFVLLLVTPIFYFWIYQALEELAAKEKVST